MSILRWLGITRPDPREAGETETVRRIAGQLERLEPNDARRLAGFAYVLARVANADLRIESTEASAMERIVAEVAELTPAEAALVVEIAKSQARLLGGTDNYTVTREYRTVSTPDQRVQLLDCLYAVAAADGSISNLESTEIAAIADELGFSRADQSAMRSRWRDQLSVLKKD
jgi:uncharacterized tellurite resistance protein B-like protein